MFLKLVMGAVLTAIVVVSGISDVASAKTESDFDLSALPKFNRPALWIGDAAPSLDLVEVVQRFPGSTIVPGKIHVVEFWATWCKPCIESFPHLSELQQLHGNEVTVVGVNVQDVKDGESATGRSHRIRAFVEAQGEKMKFGIAIGSPVSTEQSWLSSTSLGAGLPFAFIVDRRGRIAWMGHTSDLDRPLAEITAGSFDAEAFAGSLEDKLTSVLQFEAVSELLRRTDPSEGYAAMRSLVDGPFAMRPMLLRKLAVLVTTDEAVTVRDLELAWSAADRANELTGGKNPWFLIAAAEVEFARGHVSEAVGFARIARAGCKPHFEEWYDEQLARFEGAAE